MKPRSLSPLIAVSAVLLVSLGTPGCARRTAQAPPEPAAAPPVATTAPAEPAPIEPTPAEPVIEVPIPPPPVVSAPELDPARFGFDSDALGPSARAALDQAAKLMREQPDLHVTIEGHCDERGTAEYNQALGERRASAAREYLMSAGIASERIQIVSYGEERPLAEGHDEAAWASNRRAQVVVRPGMMGGAVNPDDSK